MSVSTVALKASLALWRRRHAFRQRRLDVAHERNDSSGIRKWHALLVVAGQNIRRRERQLHPEPPPLSTNRQKVVAMARQAKRNYEMNPGAWHYLAGGVPNTIVMRPSPRGYRSDCSQFVAGIYKEADVKCPGTGTYTYTNTVSIAAGGVLTTNPKPGDLGLYGSRWYPHHVELVVDTKPLTFIGHGTQRVDSLTPGLPSYYLTFPQLDA